MGCCSSQPQGILIGPGYKLSEVDEELQCILNTYNGSKSAYNEPIAILDNVTLNPLGYSLWCGRLNAFKYLKEKIGASIPCMELLFEKQNLSGIEIILDKGYIDLLKYYLPEYLLEFSTDLTQSQVLKKPLIQIAVSKGFVHVVNFIHQYFIDVDPPTAFNLHYVNPENGENSALIACRLRNFPMIRLLNETCKADFSVITNKNKNALQLVLFEQDTTFKVNELFKYLIENTNVNVKHKYKKILKKLEDPETVDYYKKTLGKAGVDLNKKSEIENIEAYISPIRNGREKSQTTIGAISSISILDITNPFSISLLQEENLIN